MTDYTKPISSSNPPESKGTRTQATVPVVNAPLAPLSKPSLDDTANLTPPVEKKASKTGR